MLNIHAHDQELHRPDVHVNHRGLLPQLSVCPRSTPYPSVVAPISCFSGDSKPSQGHPDSCSYTQFEPLCNDQITPRRICPPFGGHTQTSAASEQSAPSRYALNARSMTSSTVSPRVAATAAARASSSSSIPSSWGSMRGTILSVATPRVATRRERCWNDGGVAKTPLHAFRIPQGIYEAARDKAKRRGDNLSEKVRDALIDYIEEPDDDDEGEQ